LKTKEEHITLVHSNQTHIPSASVSIAKKIQESAQPRVKYKNGDRGSPIPCYEGPGPKVGHKEYAFTEFVIMDFMGLCF
jgi:hypothetical protein